MSTIMDEDPEFREGSRSEPRKVTPGDKRTSVPKLYSGGVPDFGLALAGCANRTF